MSTDLLYLGVLIENPISVKEYTEFPYMFIPWRSIIN